MCNISTSCCNALQYSPVIPSGSPAQKRTSAVNAPPPPMPSVLSDVQLTLRGARRRQSRSKACAEHHTSLPARFEMLWRTPNPQWGFSAFHLAMHWPPRASGIQTSLRRCFLTLASLTSQGLLLCKVQEQPLKRGIPESWESSTSTCIYLRSSTLSLHQACVRCCVPLLLSCKITICCFLPFTPCAKVFCTEGGRPQSETTL